MSPPNHSKFRRFKKILLLPFRAVTNVMCAIQDALDAILSIAGLKQPRRKRRNKDFERAGREHRGPNFVDSSAASELNRADRVRDQEILQQVKIENRILRRNDEKAEQLRQIMEEESLSFSQGAAINHLAEVNRRAAEKKKKDQRGPNGEIKPVDE